MPLSLVPYTGQWVTAARAFNQRLLAAQAPIDFHLAEEPSRLQHLIVDGEMVRGGCLVELEPGQVGHEAAEIASIQSPLSEGLFDPQHAGVSSWLVREVARRWPFSYSVGMGAMDRPYPRLLRALRWKVVPVPFYFRVLNGGRFLRFMPLVSQKPGARLFGSIPLLPALAFGALHWWKAADGGRVAGLETIAALSPQDTAAWGAVKERLTFAVSRDSAVLNTRYRDPQGRMTVARFRGGFVVLKFTHFTADRHFGSLRVATWADGLSEPGKEGLLVSAAEEAATALGADLLVTNQLYDPHQRALERRGWLPHASNFLVAWSPAAAGLLDPAKCHVSRRDGDGLISL